MSSASPDPEPHVLAVSVLFESITYSVESNAFLFGVLMITLIDFSQIHTEFEAKKREKPLSLDLHV